MAEKLKDILTGIGNWLGQTVFTIPINEQIKVVFLMWHLILAALILLIVVLIVVAAGAAKRRRKKRLKGAQVALGPDVPPKPVVTTENPPPSDPIEIGNLQEQGSREEQQDAFGMSMLRLYTDKGFTAVLCDGMGGMSDGGRVARYAVERLLNYEGMQDHLVSMDHAADDADKVAGEIRDVSREVYRNLFGRGGSTLVMTYIYDDQLMFWCAGDSDLFLKRNGELYTLNERHEYQKDLLRKVMRGRVNEEMAFTDPQAGALTQYIGQQAVEPEYTHAPLKLLPGDTLFLCSDGISDTLSLTEISEALQMTPHDAAQDLHAKVVDHAVPSQDNYTAIIIRYNGRVKN